jgi:ABC-type oligopeptide transport system ATPase subunit
VARAVDALQRAVEQGETFTLVGDSCGGMATLGKATA